MAQTMNYLVIFLLISISNTSLAMTAYNIVDFGARPDGRTDSAQAFLAAWAKACGDNKSAMIFVPAGQFFVSEALFQGPCNNENLTISILSTLVAPSNYTQSRNWITFKNVKGVSIYGGTLDGQGRAFWNCKLAGHDCPAGATSLTIEESSNVLISGLSSLNSELMHIGIYASSYVTVNGTNISAPGTSPNTDGIHIQMSTNVTVTKATIETGDDCISIGEGTSNVWIQKVNCGPGHGISIGSLGESPQEEPVYNITVTSVVFTGTQNGLRIKTWAKPSNGSVRGVNFEQAVMTNVQNPIIIDQNYCIAKKTCPNQSSGVKIGEVSYSDIRGSSATQLAVIFDCSPSKPCSRIRMKDINLTYGNGPAQSSCRSVNGTTSGFIKPPSCL